MAFVALLAVLIIAVYAPFFAGQVLYNRDLVRWAFPARWFARHAIEQGQLPWWNPNVGLGFSTLADPLYGLFYPPNFLHLTGSLPVVMMFVILAHLVWGAAGMAVLGRQFCLRKGAAVIAGLAWALSGYIFSLWTFGSILPAAAWMPWQACTFIHLVGRTREGKPWGLAAAAAALAVGLAMLSGDVFVAMMGIILGLGLAAAWIVGEPRVLGARETRGYRWRWCCVLAFVVVGVVGATLSMVQWLPAVRALATTERAGGVSAGYAGAGSLTPWRAVELAAPVAFARAWVEDPGAPWVGRVLGGQPLGMNIYLGGSVLALAFCALSWPRRGRDESERRLVWRVWAVCGLAAFDLLLALGSHTPIFSLWRHLVPPLAYMRSPEKYLLMLVPCIALLAGLGAERVLQAPSPKPWRRLAALTGLLGVLALLAPSVVDANLGSSLRTGLGHGCATSAGVVVLLFLSSRRKMLVPGLLIALVAADLTLGSQFLQRYMDSASLTTIPPLARVIAADVRETGRPAPRLFRGTMVHESAAQAGGIDNDRIAFETLRDNLSTVHGIAILPGYEATLPPALTDILGRGRRDALRLLSVDYALLSVRHDSGDNPPGLEPVFDPLPGIRLYRVMRRLPRAYLGLASERVADVLHSPRLLDEDVVSGRRVLLPVEGSSPVRSGAEREPIPCDLEEFETTRVRARCVAPAPALAVFVEQTAPGWTATVDNLPVPVMVANGVMRAVSVPPGTHEIELRFHPPGLQGGVLGSGLGLLLVLALTLAGLRANRRMDVADVG